MKQTDALSQRLQDRSAVLVSVERTQGSAPREAGAWMAVFADAVLGSVGGGQLEYQAIDRARDLLVSGQAPAVLRYPLGPSLGQCCGGVMHLRFERITQADSESLAQRLRVAPMPVVLFGGGHVGRALARLLADLPCELAWIDSRDGIFPALPAGNVLCEHSDPVQAAVRDLRVVRAGSHVLIMSFSHAEDLDVLAACLLRQRSRGDLPFIGLIGSQTKWAKFRHQLEARGFSAQELDRVTCPIGVAGIGSKLPEVIAVSVAAQLLRGS